MTVYNQLHCTKTVNEKNSSINAGICKILIFMVLKPVLILIHVHASTHPKNMSEREQPYSMHLRSLTS